MTDLAIPTVHLNGTSRDSLIDGLCDAGHVVIDAMKALADAAPNARDYYVQGDDAYGIARTQHEERLAKLKSVYDELAAIAQAIDDS